MKKIFYLPVILSCVACMPVEPETKQPEKTPHEMYLEEAQQEQTDILVAETMVKRVAKIKEVYEDKYPEVVDSGMFSTYRDGNAEYLEVFMKSGETKDNLKCFINEPLDNSDECILIRRKISVSEMDSFNYQALFPVGHKVLNNEYFTKVLKASGYYNLEMCDEQAGKWTTTEIQNCKNNIENYMTNLVMGTLPLCRNVAKEDFKEFFDVPDFATLKKEAVGNPLAVYMTANLGQAFREMEAIYGTSLKNCDKFIEQNKAEHLKQEQQFEIEHRCVMGNIQAERKQECKKIIKLINDAKKNR